MTNGLELEQKGIFKHEGFPDDQLIRKPFHLDAIHRSKSLLACEGS